MLLSLSPGVLGPWIPLPTLGGELAHGQRPESPCEDFDKDCLGVLVLVPSSCHHAAHLVHVAACEPHPLGKHGSPRAYFHGAVLGAWHAVSMDPSWDGLVLGHAWAERPSPGVMLLDRAPEGHELALAFSIAFCPHEELVE